MKPLGKSELNKMQGIDIMDKLAEGHTLKSYNEEYYNSISNFRMINVPIESDNKLFYHFEQNENASVSTTTGQLLVKYISYINLRLLMKK
jgi:hypothetical protein